MGSGYFGAVDQRKFKILIQVLLRNRFLIYFISASFASVQIISLSPF